MSKHRWVPAALGTAGLLLAGVAAAPTHAQEAAQLGTFNAVYVVVAGEEGMGNVTVINADTDRVAATIPLTTRCGRTTSTSARTAPGWPWPPPAWTSPVDTGGRRRKT